MGLVGDFISGVGNALSGAVKAVGSFVGKVGSVITDKAKLFLGLGETVFKAVVEIVRIIAQILGIVDEDTTPEELGAKAEKAEKTRDDFESNEAYLNYLQDEVELEPGELDNVSEDQLNAYKAVGASLMTEVISEKVQVNIDDSMWIVSSLKKLSPELVVSMIKKFDEYGQSTKVFEKFVDKDLKGKENGDAFDAIFDAFKATYPNKPESELEKQVDDLQRKGE